MHFRKRIGETGAEKIFQHAIALHGRAAPTAHVSIDSTVQEKNITYPTDAKLHKQIIDRCVKKARQQDIILRRSYVRTSKQLLRDTYNGTPPKAQEKISPGEKETENDSGPFGA